jgi:CheY-like chemotaxis protein
MRILLADDNVEIRAALRLLLEELGVSDIAEAADGRQLLSVLAQGPVDVILLDWELPEGGSRSHYSAAAQAHSAALVEEVRRTCVDARIIAMSVGPEAEESSHLAGCDGFVNRNEPPDRLLALLRLGRCC